MEYKQKKFLGRFDAKSRGPEWGSIFFFEGGRFLGRGCAPTAKGRPKRGILPSSRHLTPDTRSRASAHWPYPMALKKYLHKNLGKIKHKK